jgi:hypothetical protein
MARSYDWAAPAKLFYWPADDGSEEEVVYPSLSDAVRAAAEGDGDAASAWIITQEGDILNPKMILELRLDMAPRRKQRRSSPLALFGWSGTA